MKNNVITILISVTLSVVLSVVLSALFLGNGLTLGSTITTTDSDDTLETFRTNVNSSLTSLQAFASSTSLIGIMASTSPFGNIGIGSATATSSISGGYMCFYFRTEGGTGLFIKLNPTQSTIFSTSTSSCL